MKKLKSTFFFIMGSLILLLFGVASWMLHSLVVDFFTKIFLKYGIVDETQQNLFGILVIFVIIVVLSLILNKKVKITEVFRKLID